MPRSAELSPRRLELVEAVQWIAEDSPAAARRLRAAVVEAARRIGDHALIGVSRPELTPLAVRVLAPTSFPYLLIYNPEAKPPLILRLVHGARDLPAVLQDLAIPSPRRS